MNEQELIQFRIDCQQYKDRIIKLEKIVEEQEKRISELERRNDKTDFQYEQIMNTLNKLTDTTIPNLGKEIQSLKEKPIRRYDTAISSIINTVIGAIVGFIAAKIFK